MIAMGEDAPPWLAQVFAALLAKFPAAAVGLVYIWVGGLLLRWFGAGQ